mgnify:CR=1 FL=1
MRTMTSRRLLGLFAALVLALGVLPHSSPPAHAADRVVTLVGSLQSEVGCPGDWDPSCGSSALVQGPPGVWTTTLTVPAGDFEYKVALNGGWDTNYGANAVAGGANIPLVLAAPTAVTFFYSDATHLITDDVSTALTFAVGSFQSELGCSGDWKEDCPAAWLADPAGGSVLTFSTTAIPVGAYEAKVAVGLSWDINYGAGGVRVARTSRSVSPKRARP